VAKAKAEAEAAMKEAKKAQKELEKEKQKAKAAAAAAAPTIVRQWSCEVDGGGMADYDKETNDIINTAFETKSACSFTARNFKYSIDWVNNVQINESTQAKRNIFAKETTQVDSEVAKAKAEAEAAMKEAKKAQKELEKEKQKAKAAAAAAAPTIVRQWSCEVDGGGMADYDKETNDIINTAFETKSACSFTARNFKYSIDWVNNVQINESTKVKRKITSKILTVYDGHSSGTLPVPSQVITPILPSRSFKATDIFQQHYRTAESQFDRMLKHSGVANRKITKVEWIYQPHLVDNFEKTRSKYNKKYGVGKHEELLVFHGTQEASISNIIKTGFKLKKVGSATDSGYYGAGIYFSELTATSIGYAKCNKLLLCQVLLGKVKSLTAQQLMHGAGCSTGYDSHGVNPNSSGSFSEIVIFDEAAMIPTYVIHYV